MQSETNFFTGNGSQTSRLSRWGDYSSITVDPVDDCTFWIANEYIPAYGTFNWRTRIGNFKFASCIPPDFSLSISPSSQSVARGGSTTYTVTIAPNSTFSGAVQLSAGGLPTGAGATFNPNPATSASTMTVTTSTTTPISNSTVTATGTSGSLTHSATTTLTVTATSSVSGTVKDVGGAAVGGATVEAYQAGAGAVCCSLVAQAVSDSSGNYSFALPAGTYKFWISTPPGLPSQWYGGTDFASATAVVVSGPTVVNITLFPKVSGTVKDVGGAAVGGATVQAYQAGAGAVCCTFVAQPAVSDSSGNYSFALPAGTYKFWISSTPPGLPSQWYGGTDFASATAVVVSGPTVVNITLHH
jgi:hypothetical protein